MTKTFVFELRDCPECNNIQTLTVNTQQNYVFLLTDLSIRIYKRLVYHSLELSKIINIPYGGCNSLLYVDEVMGFFCQDQTMKSLKFFDMDYEDHSFASSYIIYVIIGVSATFVIIVIITLIMNKRKKVIKKREVLEDLINHSKYLKEHSYRIKSYSHSHVKKDSNDTSIDEIAPTHECNNVESSKKNNLTQSCLKNQTNYKSDSLRKSTKSTRNKTTTVDEPDSRDFVSESLIDQKHESLTIKKKRGNRKIRDII